MYPYPKRRNKNYERFAIAVEFLNAYDIMDVIDNISCIQTYSVGWFVFFFVALAVSALHLAFPISLIKEDENDSECRRILSSLVTLVFTDISFAIIRGFVMFHEDSLQLGFNFFSKNVTVASWRLYLIMKSLLCQQEEMEQEQNHYIIYYNESTM